MIGSYTGKQIHDKIKLMCKYNTQIQNLRTRILEYVIFLICVLDIPAKQVAS